MILIYSNSNYSGISVTWEYVFSLDKSDEFRLTIKDYVANKLVKFGINTNKKHLFK